MSMTNGRINRAGKIHFHDAKLSVWEEGLSDARKAGDLKGEDAWCRQFKRRVRAHRAGTAPPRLDHTGPRPLTRGQRACAGPRRISLELTDTLELSHD